MWRKESEVRDFVYLAAWTSGPYRLLELQKPVSAAPWAFRQPSGFSLRARQGQELIHLFIFWGGVGSGWVQGGLK